jgi:hypothetical protein
MRAIINWPPNWISQLCMVMPPQAVPGGIFKLHLDHDEKDAERMGG